MWQDVEIAHMASKSLDLRATLNMFAFEQSTRGRKEISRLETAYADLFSGVP
jgi:hypothetical protein